MTERIARRPRRACQKDLDARWTQKGGLSYYGYKNHVKVDAASKFIDNFTVTHAAVHDSQPIEELLRESDREIVLWADSAYTGAGIAGLLERFSMLANIHEKGTAWLDEPQVPVTAGAGAACRNVRAFA